MTVSGIHHVTAITSDAQRNLDFYCGVLGLRLVKITVNFDDPSSYHFYYGDGTGSPGSIMTFFVWRGAFRGREGNGQVSQTAFSVPPDSAPFWIDRLEKAGIDAESSDRFGLHRLEFRDFDGLPLELVECEDHRAGWAGGDIDGIYAVRGLYGATATVPDIEASSGMLALLGFTRGEEEGGRVVFTSGSPMGGSLELLENRTLRRGSTGAGQVHHIAWRVPDDAAQLEIGGTLEKEGTFAFPVRERFYFKSIYFREPGGVLYEIATDKPGFAVDEAPEALGQKLMLPPQFEPQRAIIEARLPSFTLLSGTQIP